MTASKTDQIIEDIVDRYRAGYPIIWVKTEEYARALEILRTRFLKENERCMRIIKERFNLSTLDENKLDKDEVIRAREIPITLKPKNIFHWDPINGLVNTTDLKTACEKVYPFPPKTTAGGQVGPEMEGPPYSHILAWANHLKTATVPPGSIVLVNGFHNLLDACPPTEHGKMRHAILQIIQPSIRKINSVIRYGLREEDSFRSVIIVGPKPPHPVLSADVMTYLDVIDLPRPNETEIEEMIELQLGDKKTNEGEIVTADKKLVTTCARELKGTTVFQSENALMLTFIKKRALDADTIRKQYKGIMELHPALTLAEYKETWEDLVGFELYKKFIDALFHPSQTKKDLKGILFVGVPGTGKSMAAKATGRHLGIKTIFCNLGRVFGKWQGDAEANTESLFRSIDACGKAIVFMDEIEKGMGGMGKGSGTDGGTGDRVMQQTLTWMNDHDSGAFLIGTANEPRILPQELLREGRWDCIFNVPPPNKKQRIALATLYGNKAEMEVDSEEIAERTENWVGAEIKGLMEKAQVFRLASKNDREALQTAFSYVKPMVVTDSKRFMERLEQSKEQGVSVNIEEDSISNFEIPDMPRLPRKRTRGLEE